MEDARAPASPRSDRGTESSPPEYLHGDCGIRLQVVDQCPDGPTDLLHCACGAEIYRVEVAAP